MFIIMVFNNYSKDSVLWVLEKGCFIFCERLWVWFLEKLYLFGVGLMRMRRRRLEESNGF